MREELEMQEAVDEVHKYLAESRKRQREERDNRRKADQERRREQAKEKFEQDKKKREEESRKVMEELDRIHDLEMRKQKKLEEEMKREEEERIAIEQAEVCFTGWILVHLRFFSITLVFLWLINLIIGRRKGKSSGRRRAREKAPRNWSSGIYFHISLKVWFSLILFFNQNVDKQFRFPILLAIILLDICGNNSMYLEIFSDGRRGNAALVQSRARNKSSENITGDGTRKNGRGRREEKVSTY